jgi:hypothetical protein
MDFEKEQLPGKALRCLRLLSFSACHGNQEFKAGLSEGRPKSSKSTLARSHALRPGPASTSLRSSLPAPQVKEKLHDLGEAGSSSYIPRFRKTTLVANFEIPSEIAQQRVDFRSREFVVVMQETTTLDRIGLSRLP